MTDFSRPSGHAQPKFGARLYSLLASRSARPNRGIAAAAILLISAVLLVVWLQAFGGAPSVFAQGNNAAMGKPTIAGTVEIYNTITASISTVTDSDEFPDINNDNVPDNGEWRWYRDSVHPDRLIIDSQASGNTFTLNSGVANGKIIVAFVFTDNDGNTESLASDPTVRVPSGAIIEVSRTRNGVESWDISNPPVAGVKIRANTEHVDYPNLHSTPNFQYQWVHMNAGVMQDAIPTNSNTTVISGATDQEYTLVASDAGKVFQLRLTFAITPSGTRTTYANFNTLHTVIPPPSVDVARGAPSREAEVHQTLTATVTTVGIDSPMFTYQWHALPSGQSPSTRNRISGATERTYTPTAADIGKRMVVIARITGTNTGTLSAMSEPTLPVRSSAVITASSGFFYDTNPATADTLTADIERMNLRGSGTSSPPTFTYQWIKVDANGVRTGNADGTNSTAKSYTLTAADDGDRLQVEITFTPRDPGGASSRTVMANAATPIIRERPPVDLASNLRALVPADGGSVRLSWRTTSTPGGTAPSGFRLRYKPSSLADYQGNLAQDWTTVSGGGRARSMTIGNLINGAAYTFELRSFDQFGEATDAVSASATYRHKTIDCA